MRFLKPVVASAALAAALAAAPVALAQPSQSTSVIVLNVGQLVANSEIGRDMNTKLQQIGQQMQGELQPEQTAIQTEEQSIQTAAHGKTPEQIRADTALSNRINALNQRAQTFRERQVNMARDFEYTQQMTYQDFNQQITPVVREVMQARGAGVVLDASSIQLVEPQFDATNDVVQRLNQRLHTINVTRRSAPPPQQPGAPNPPRP
ncbi:MAG TPA: OmpH family outer membrane protein [Caulobacterales bacterium]|nr:OmpH family outer membrane protein [Caulobacterales bacterium]